MTALTTALGQTATSGQTAAPGQINLVNMLLAQKNPQILADQLAISRQQALAQQLMDQGNQDQDPAKLANPGGYVIPISPWTAAAKALEKGIGGYMQGQTDKQTIDMYKQLGKPDQPTGDLMGTATNAAINQEGGEGPATASDVGNQYRQNLVAALQPQSGNSAPTLNDIIYENTVPEWQKNQYAMQLEAWKHQLDLQNAGAIKKAQESNSIIQSPEGPIWGNQVGGSGLPPPTPLQTPLQPPLPPSLQMGIQNQAMPGVPTAPPVTATPPPLASTNPATPTAPKGDPNMTPDQQNAALGDVFNADKPAAPVTLTGQNAPEAPPTSTGTILNPRGTTTPLTPDELEKERQNGTPPNPLIAADGKPILPNLDKIPPADSSGTPKYNTVNKTTGVNQTKVFQESDDKANDSAATNRNSLTKEGAIIDGIIKELGNVKSGTTLAQYPDAVNRLVGAGLITGDNAKKLSDIQAIRTFLMKDAILQLRDQNANLEGNPSRIMQAELSANLEHGLSTNMQPEALYKVLTQAKGMVNYNKNMIDNYQAIGGLGNRVAGGYTKRPMDFFQQWQASHDPADYIANAEKETPPFKGMPGNVDAPTNRPPLSSFMK